MLETHEQVLRVPTAALLSGDKVLVVLYAADYTVRKGIPTYVVDQSGRARSGFDKSVINEADYYIDKDPVYAKALLPTMGR